ncbi:MAG: hypothetical protein IJY08_06325 [Clostridia bacterium]|nr:hypothetical protein [Clostridia bacterium]
MNENHNDKEYTEGIAVRGGFLGKLDNFWYHHKWVTLIAGFFIIVGVICTAQMCNKEADDLTVVYAGRNNLTAAEVENISAVLEAVAPKDFDGDGRKSIAVSNYNILSEEQIKDLRTETDADGNSKHVDNSYYSSQYSTYNNYLKTGESSILFVEEWEYESLASSGILVRLDEVLDTVPESAFSDYGIRLGDTDLYEEYGVMKLLPRDTVICIMHVVVGNSGDEEYFEREKEMFRAIVTYESEDKTTEG